ncbi:hypothetical protein [Pseudomonas sp. GXZC]|uniref:hypothetical protein n=1 Tax=Pseudomonas sp. GXZC TaxID=3003351 RepID=UPI0022AB48F3|nr:hypothetical protein [Pseudomonas sp. GXZC]WAT31781.1 hypothetical protein OZ428_15990 [Pseudomonas sp. GXZC]
MWRLRRAVGYIVFFVGLILAFYAGAEERYWAAAGFVAGGIACAATVVLWEAMGGSVSLLLSMFSLAVTIFSVLDVFSSSYALNQREIDAQRDFVEVLVHEQFEFSRLDGDNRQLVAKAFKACVLQSYADQQDFVVNAGKAVYFGPGLTLVDGLSSRLDGKHPVRCLDYYRELRKTQAHLFLRMEKHHPWLLEKQSG